MEIQFLSIQRQKSDQCRDRNLNKWVRALLRLNSAEKRLEICIEIAATTRTERPALTEEPEDVEKDLYFLTSPNDNSPVTARPGQ